MPRRRQKTAEPENGGPASGNPPQDSSGGQGTGCRTEQAEEQERPSLAALEWDDRDDKGNRNATGAKRESEEAVVPMKRGRITSWREGPLVESSFLRR